MPEESLIDVGALDRLRDWGGDKLVAQMVRLYIENAAVRIEQIEAGLRDPGEIEQTRHGAHSLKSSAANVGAARVRLIASDLETRALDNDTAGAASLVADLRLALVEAEARLRSLVRVEPE